jgi:hypothetical protein
MAFQLLSTAFCFPQQLSAFLNGFPIFLNGFPLSEKSKKIYLRRQVSKRSLFKLRICGHLLPELCNSRYNVYISPNTWEVEDDIYGFIVWWLYVGCYSLWVEGGFPKACEVASVGFQDRWLVGCDCGGVIIIDCCSLFESTVVYPASASFGTLTSVECSPGTTFISLAAGRSCVLGASSSLLCLRVYPGT